MRGWNSAAVSSAGFEIIHIAFGLSRIVNNLE